MGGIIIDPENEETPGGAEQEGTLPGEKKADESWKQRAEEEKKKLEEKARPSRPELPPATFVGLLDELSLRAMVALGQIANPVTGEAGFDPASARYTIDLIAVLEEKTKGNLQPGESQLLTELLHSLRMVFVQVSRMAEKGELEGAPGEGKKPKIVT
jgi:hypothetical protein